jgi:hypothetical protein
VCEVHNPPSLMGGRQMYSPPEHRCSFPHGGGTTMPAGGAPELSGISLDETITVVRHMA